ncbi:MAG: NirD/YgiW/YdeI family stress tolerance protein [Rikenellaceae bacterium]|nr:NirD/YgiW/YdeI family stress tolerance protein [Bacteroidota bacterium]MEA4867609.1 NirD/YgiW/YdeI family stress tolerance protein [Rikenellaceae bacterium]
MKSLNVLKLLLLFFTLVSASSLSYGQYKGPGVTDKTYTVKEVLDNASRLDRSDALVKVQGFIVNQINADTYEFKDKTGAIKVEIDRKRLPNKPFDDKTELILIGEVDNDIFEPVEIEVKEVLFVDPDNKTVK